MDNIKISVVVPVYNAEPFLKEAMESLLNQTFKNFEIICVNDGSKDNSLEMLNDFASKDQRVRVIDKPNGGCGSARNMGLDNVRGEYIYFFDPDDYIDPTTFEKLYNNVIKNDSELVICNFVQFRDGEPINYNSGFNFKNILPNVDFNNYTCDYHEIKNLVLNSFMAPWFKLYKREFLERYDDFRFDLNIAFDDVPFHVKSMIRATKISFVPEYFYYYRLSNPNSVNNTKTNQIDIFKIIDIVETFLKNEGYFDEFKSEFYNFKINHIMLYIISCNFEDYYKLAKEVFYKMDLEGLNISQHQLKKYNAVLDSFSYNDFRINQGFDPIGDSEEVEFYKRVQINNNEIKKLKKENKKLKKENKKLNKLNESILNSNSWKLTSYFRKIGSIFK